MEVADALASHREKISVAPAGVMLGKTQNNLTTISLQARLLGAKDALVSCYMQLKEMNNENENKNNNNDKYI